MTKIMESVCKQARRYGDMIRMLEDLELEDDRARVRKSWGWFRHQLIDTPYLKPAVSAYNDALCEIQ